MDEQATKLLETLNAAIASGVEKLPWAAEQSLAALQAYWALYTFVGFGLFAVAGGIAVLGWKEIVKAASNDNEVGGTALLVSSVALAIAGLLICLENIGGWISPLGKILSQVIQ